MSSWSCIDIESYWWSCIVYWVFYLEPLSMQQQLVSSHFSLWGNGGCVVGNRDHRRSFHPAVLFNRLLVKTWGKSAQKHNLKLQKYHLFQLRNGTFFGLYSIYAPCHVFAYICANTRTSVLKTSQELRMLSRSLYNCKSLLLNVMIQDSQFVSNSQLCH